MRNYLYVLAVMPFAALTSPLVFLTRGDKKMKMLGMQVALLLVQLIAAVIIFFN